jgi:hypothetical protein
VHLLHRYSNTPGLLSDLEAVRWTLGRADLEDEPTLPSTERPWRLRDQLSESDLDGIVLRFKHGETMSSLAHEYGITDWSVRNLIKKRGQRLGLDIRHLVRASLTSRQTADNSRRLQPGCPSW